MANNRENRKEQAAKHHARMLTEKAAEIQRSIAETKIYSHTFDKVGEYNGNPGSMVVNMDTVSAVFEHGTGDDKTIVLNFASFKNPGGGFLIGALAQEEAVCMESTLYQVIGDSELADYYEYNAHHTNRSLYINRAMLSPGIVFVREDKETAATMLTVAAPNRSAYLNNNAGATEEENLKALKDRIGFIADIINAQNAEVAILGAFGCGVFGQDSKVVAGIFKDKMKNSTVKKIVYAVIDRGGHTKEGAYALFKKVIEG
ncbi:MAG: TIGR02452 family protein [Lachnospiraceae bacterium]|nr:TIGR02452 family protein [Lachnospiraceae bacterium]